MLKQQQYSTLSTIFGEYIEATRQLRTALGIEHCINKTPAAKPSRLKYELMNIQLKDQPFTLPIEEKIALFSEKTFNLVNAIPKDIRIRNIVHT